MLTEDKVIEIFVMADEFCKVFNTMLCRRGLYKPKEGKKRDYHRDCRMSQAEIIVIMIMFHSSNHKCLKLFYLNEICVRYRHLFPETVSYNHWRNRLLYNSLSLLRSVCWRNVQESVLWTVHC